MLQNSFHNVLVQKPGAIQETPYLCFRVQWMAKKKSRKECTSESELGKNVFSVNSFEWMYIQRALQSFALLS